MSSRSDYALRLTHAWRDHLAPRLPEAPTVISTFAGCGGSSLGYSMAGYRRLLAVEWAENAVATYRLNFPGATVYPGDVAKLEIQEALNLAGIQPGQLDVLDGSPPCQGFSTAGHREFEDPRNQLFREYCRLLTGLRPRAFVMENVSGMVKGKMKLIFADILRELKSCGYNVSARLLNAQNYGVPQSRERMIFIGLRADLEIEPTHPVGHGRPLTLIQAIGDLPKSRQVPSIDHVWIDELGRGTQWISKAAHLKPGQKLVPNQASAIRAHWNKPLPTIQSGRADMPSYVRSCTIHPDQPRTLSVRELARCQSFPDEFRFVDALRNGRHRIGNSVPPFLMRAIAQHVAKLLASD